MKNLKRFLGIILALSLVFGMLLLVSCGDKDAAEFVSIEKAEVDEDGNLILYYTDDTSVNAGKVTGGDDILGSVVVDVSADSGDEITITLNNGIELAFAILQEKELEMDIYETIAFAEDKKVTITMIDDTVLEKTLAGIRVDASAQLVFRFDDKSEYIVGKVIGDVTSGNGLACEHQFSEWEITEAATCASIGYETRTCSACNYVEYKFIPALGHTPANGVVLEATETSIVMIYSCPMCDVAKLSNVKFTDDMDGDGLINGEEIAAGSDIAKKDTDNDLLSDYDEVKVYFTDPADPDTDGDGLFDYEEVKTYGTNPAKADSDDDGLTDYEELFVYKTEVLNPDTDGDGANDGAEVAMGLDPFTVSTNANGKFDVDVTLDMNDIVKPGIDAELSIDQLNSLQIKQNDYFVEGTLGYMGQAYDYKSETALNTSATIKFVYTPDTSSGSSANVQPTIYEYDEDSNSIQPIETFVDTGTNTASAEITAFGTYILLDRTVLEDELAWIDNWGIGGADDTYTEIELVFVIDDSGSMDSNDYNYSCLEVAKTVINSFGEKASVGVVRFDDSINVLTSSLIQCTDDGKQQLGNILTRGSNFYHGGLTYLYEAVVSGAGLFSARSYNDTTYRVMIVLSDGIPNGYYYQSQAIDAATSIGAEIYTVGLGSDTSYFESNLLPMSAATGGTFQHATDYTALMGLYDKIRQKIDMTVDSDTDGIPDYYEENLMSFDGKTTIVTDKTNPDTDDDHLLDGEEVNVIYVYNFDKTQITFIGKVVSDPTKVDSDGDGVDDYYDTAPLDPAVA